MGNIIALIIEVLSFWLFFYHFDPINPFIPLWTIPNDKKINIVISIIAGTYNI